MMYFSAPVSFTISAILAAVGTGLILRVPKRLLFLAMIPFFFAIQQFVEGLIWIFSMYAIHSKNIFLFFAYVFWPIWIPFSFWMAELDLWRKQFLAICLGMGIVIGLFLAMLVPSATFDFYRNSISYYSPLNSGRFDPIVFAFYGISTIAPFFISSIRKIWIIGILSILSSLGIYLVDRYIFVSTWSFFSAIISLSLFLILEKKSFIKK